MTRTLSLRRGLPRVPGGEAWPPAQAAAATADEAVPAAPGPPPQTRPEPVVPSGAVAVGDDAAAARAAGDREAPERHGPPAPAETPERATAPGPVAVRRGLPRVAGGPAWPEVEDAVPMAAPAVAATPATTTATADTGAADDPATADATAAHAAAAAGATPGRPVAAAPATEARATGTVPLRRGLPRVSGGEAWPPVAEAARSDPQPHPSAPATAATPTTVPTPASTTEEPPAPAPTAAAAAPTAAPARRDEQPSGTEQTPQQSAPASATVPAQSGAAPTRRAPAPPTREPANARSTAPGAAEPRRTRYGRFTPLQWVGVGLASLLGLALVAAILVLASWGLLTVGAVRDFVRRHPGTAPQPASTPEGLPAWLGWQHFFNLFLMVLIIRTGLRVRREQRPPAYFSWRGTGKKMSIFAWLHLSMDALWLLNGVVFVVLLIATGQWMRIVPTSWEVFPNAASAALQYVTLRWPTENAWTHYNALQQLTYFVTVFVAAPISVVSGLRMLGVGNGSAVAERLVPVERARRLHFPTMVYFVAFIAVHVLLVLVTGMRRNLNAMFAAKGSADPSVFAADWTGFAFLVAALAVIVAAWFAVRPVVLAPIARLFGTVSSR